MRQPLVYRPLAALAALLLAGALAGAVAVLFLDLLRTSFTRIGFTWHDALLVMFASLAGSYVNIPIRAIRSKRPIVVAGYVRAFGVLYRIPVVRQSEQVTLLAVNVGGAVIPVLVSAYLLVRFPSALVYTLPATLAVTFVVHRVARPMRGVGIVSPALVPLVTAALAAGLIVALLGGSAESRFVSAYVSGTLGTLVGADLLNLGAIDDLAAPVASIGGAGTFDGIFLTGLIAVLIA
jgi:uncharacterized membrane protein